MQLKLLFAAFNKTDTIFSFLIIVSMLSIPVLPHDWGDDFALYLMQAASFSGDSSYNELYIYNPEASFYSPPVYPPGFSVMLAPIYIITGLNLSVFQIYLCLLFALACLALYYYVRSINYSAIFCIFITSLFAFHTFSLELRGQILSDVPFVGLLFLFLYLHHHQKNYIFTALIALCAFLTRSIGLVLLFAWIIELIFIFLICKNEKEKLKYNLKGILLFLAGIILLNLIFPALSGYFSSLNKNTGLETVHNNFIIYKETLSNYFGAFLYGKEPFSIIFSWICVVFFIIGTIKWILEKNRFPIIFFWIYTIVILIYPYNQGGFRLLFPLIAFIWIFIFKGVHVLLLMTRFQSITTNLLGILFGTIITFQVIHFYKNPIPEINYVLTKESKELFYQIERKVPDEEIILSARPRALALFAKRKGIYPISDVSDYHKLKEFVSLYEIKYMVYMKNNRNQNIEMLAGDKTISSLIWSNSIYKLYLLK